MLLLQCEHARIALRSFLFFMFVAEMDVAVSDVVSATHLQVILCMEAKLSPMVFVCICRIQVSQREVQVRTF